MIERMGSYLVFAFIVFLLISALVVGTWFRGGFIYGGAEVGLFAYNPERWLEISKYVWWEAVAPGQLIPHFITGIPVYFLFYILNLIGLSAQNIQQLFFFLILFLMGFGMYLLSLNILEEDNKKYSLFAGLFYMFNVYTLVSVWHRFLYSTLILAAVLPFLILFWRRWIKEGRIFNLNFFLLINFLSVYMYGNLASLATVWISLSLVSLTEVFFPWQGKTFAWKLCLRFLWGFIFWFLTNIWWIAPTFSIAPGLLSKQHSGEDNLGTLVAISRQTIMPYLLQLANPFYLFYRAELGQIYSNFIFKMIPWTLSAVIFLGVIVGLKLKSYAKYSVIFIIAVLLSKGAASPFSYPYIFGLKSAYVFGVLRNPFEKLGIMLPLFGAILFAIGLQTFFKWGHRRFGLILTKLTIILVFVFLFGYAWPMFGGKIFERNEFSVKVKVLESYIQADQWLKQQKENQGVILHLPVSGKDVVTYDWDEGYHGVDQNEILFTSLPSLSRNVGIKRIDDTLGSLSYIFHPPFSANKGQILKILQSFNVKFIVLHKDIKWNDKDTYGEKGYLLEPNSIEKVLDSLDFLKKERQFNSLVVYKLTDENYKPILTLIDNIQIVYPGESDIMQILSKISNEADIITPVFGNIDDMISQRVRQTLVFPYKKIEYFESSPSATVAQTNYVYNRLLQIKAYFSSLGSLQSEEIARDLISLTDKLPQLSAPRKFVNYQESLSNLLGKYSENFNIHRLFSKDIGSIFRLHLMVLSQIGDQSEAAQIIEDNMVRLEIFPQYKTPGRVFKFVVPSQGDYELLLNAPWKEAAIRINGAGIASDRNAKLDKGAYEISDNFINGATEDDLVLRLKEVDQLTPSAGNVLRFKKENPVSYSGNISLDHPTFVNFAQGFHPGWVLTLNKDGESFEVNKHFLGNLYGNTWWIDKIGDFNFKIEFIPQKSADRGVIVAITATILLVLLNGYSYWRELHRR